MKYIHAISFLTLGVACDAFAPAHRNSAPRSTAQMAVDPHFFNDIPSHMHSLQDAFSTLSLSDATDAVDSLPDPGSVASSAGDVVDEAAKDKNGWFGFLTGPTKSLLIGIHSLLVSAGLKSNAWGVSIILLTLGIKLATFPLTKTQLESTNKMQTLQPTIKEIQAKYQSNPEVMNQKIAEIYRSNSVNPLAGCIPSLVQIPVFIGLYRSVLELAKNNQLDESFLWLPNLEGPVYGADPTKGSAWLFEGWSNGTPPLGWDDTIAFLILPVFLVASQFASMELMAPKDSQQQNNIVLKLLPLMIGWFSLNVPAALGLYWVTNNIVTTATSVIIRNTMKMEPVSADGLTASAPAPQQEVFTPAPLREKPAGFSNESSSRPNSDGVSPITSAIDAEVMEDDDDDDSSGEGMAETSKKVRGKKKKKRKN